MTDTQTDRQTDRHLLLLIIVRLLLLLQELGAVRSRELHPILGGENFLTEKHCGKLVGDTQVGPVHARARAHHYERDVLRARAA